VTNRGRSMIVMTRSQDHVRAINSTLRKACHPCPAPGSVPPRPRAMRSPPYHPYLLVAFFDELDSVLASL